MAKIPFSIDYRPQIESGEYKVVTGDDRPVRIISWDKKTYCGKTEIVALVLTPQGDKETVQFYHPDGTLIVSSHNEKFKLFIITPEPELNEFEKRVRFIISECNRKRYTPENIDDVKGIAKGLLELVKKELCKGCNENLEGYIKGREDAEKDVPRWKKAKEYMELGPNDFVFTLDSDGKCSPYWDTEVEGGQFYITESDIENLPKEEE